MDQRRSSATKAALREEMVAGDALVLCNSKSSPSIQTAEATLPQLTDPRSEHTSSLPACRCIPLSPTRSTAARPDGLRDAEERGARARTIIPSQATRSSREGATPRGSSLSHANTTTRRSLPSPEPCRHKHGVCRPGSSVSATYSTSGARSKSVPAVCRRDRDLSRETSLDRAPQTNGARGCPRGLRPGPAIPRSRTDGRPSRTACTRCTCHVTRATWPEGRAIVYGAPTAIEIHWQRSLMADAATYDSPIRRWVTRRACVR